MHALIPLVAARGLAPEVQLLYAWLSTTVTWRLLGAGKLTVTVPEAVLPWEFCTGYGKVAVAAAVFPGIDSMKPPLASTTRVPPEGAVDAVVTIVRARLFGSELPNRRPGEESFR